MFEINETPWDDAHIRILNFVNDMQDKGIFPFQRGKSGSPIRPIGKGVSLSGPSFIFEPKISTEPLQPIHIEFKDAT